MKVDLPPQGLGVPRIEMPQIKSTDVNDFVRFLNNEGISVRRRKVPVGKLKLTQLEIDDNKVTQLMGADSKHLSKVVLVSKDWYMLDGHHRLVALYNKDRNFRIEILQIDLKIDSLLKMSKNYPKVFYKRVNEQMSLREYIESRLDEVLVRFAKKAYPKFGHIVILAGGAGSGKGFVKKNLLGIEGKTFDVDDLKKMVMGSDKLAKQIKDETGQDISKFDLKKPENVSKIHDIISSVYRIDKKDQKRVFSSVLAAHPDRKPNLIFDVTLKDLSKLEKISRNVQELGYEKRNIHIVWVLNHFEVASDQNSGRDRVVPEEILLATHEGAALTMKKILDMDKKLNRYMDGDIHLTWNQAKIDSEYIKGDEKKSVITGKKTRGAFIKRSDYITLKNAGRPQLSTDKLSREIIEKIKKYIPKTNIWK